MEYLDVFDFFNVPRLPVGMEGLNGNGNVNGGGNGGNGGVGGGEGLQMPEFGSEFNITNFSIDAGSDWFLKNPA